MRATYDTTKPRYTVKPDFYQPERDFETLNLHEANFFAGLLGYFVEVHEWCAQRNIFVTTGNL